MPPDWYREELGLLALLVFVALASAGYVLSTPAGRVLTEALR